MHSHMFAASSNREAMTKQILKIDSRLEKGYVYMSLRGKLMLHVGVVTARIHPASTISRRYEEQEFNIFSRGLSEKNMATHGPSLIRRQRGHPGVVLPLVIYNSADH